ncbi:hypothetical protein DFH06DRAFT_1323471 [Mycena polygramma]|nr:hypothetical protein DFH06DRAFT_1323471 [Mycena polygramma]
MPHFADLPPEVSLQIFPHLPLKALITGEGVCRLWKQFISIADINPARHSLWALYRKIVNDPLFLPTRPWLLANLRPFDRQAYIEALLAQHNYIPEDFRLWILEWPARAVIACAWPGLAETYCGRPPEEGDNIERMIGCNFLSRIPPLVHRITLDPETICLPELNSDGEGWADGYGSESNDSDSDDSDQSQWSDPEEYFRSREAFGYSPPPRSGENPVHLTFPALLVWEYDERQVWLALDPDTPYAIYYLQDVQYIHGESRQYPSWISWLEAQLRKIHREARNRDNSVYPPDAFSTGDIYGDSEPPSQGIDKEADPAPASGEQVWLDSYSDLPPEPRVSDEERFRSWRRFEELWTSEDEANHRSMGIHVAGRYAASSIRVG